MKCLWWCDRGILSRGLGGPNIKKEWVWAWVCPGYEHGTRLNKNSEFKRQNIWELLIRFNRCFLIDKINSSFQWKILGNCPLNFHKYMKTQKVAKKNSWTWKWSFFDREFVKSEKFVREFVNWKVTGGASLILNFKNIGYF